MNGYIFMPDLAVYRMLLFLLHVQASAEILPGGRSILLCSARLSVSRTSGGWYSRPARQFFQQQNAQPCSMRSREVALHKQTAQGLRTAGLASLPGRKMSDPFAPARDAQPHPLCM